MAYHPLAGVDLPALRRELLTRTGRRPLHAINSGGHEHWRETGDLTALRDSIATSGQHHPIITRPDGVILDGWRRLAALHLIGDGRHATILTATDIVEAHAALGIADDEHRVPHEFAEKMMLAELVNKLPVTRIPQPRIKAELTANLFGTGRSTYYAYHQLRRWAADEALPEEVREAAERAREEIAARDGKRARSLYDNVFPLVRDARAGTVPATPEPRTADYDPGELPRPLERVVTAILGTANHAEALTRIRPTQLAALPPEARAACRAWLTAATKDIHRARRHLTP